MFASKFVEMDCCLILDVMMATMKMVMAAHLSVKCNLCLGVSTEVRHQNPTASMQNIIKLSYFFIKSIESRETMPVFLYLSSLLPRSY